MPTKTTPNLQIAELRQQVDKWRCRAETAEGLLRAFNAGCSINLGPVQLNMMARSLTVDGESVVLTPLLYKLFEYLALNATGALVNRDQISLGLGRPDMHPGTLAFHISVLRALLGKHRGLIQTVRGKGWRIAEEVPKP
jgi:two-component system alkaline phosphatase synthesis response regulator PhoP